MDVLRPVNHYGYIYIYICIRAITDSGSDWTGCAVWHITRTPALVTAIPNEPSGYCGLQCRGQMTRVCIISGWWQRPCQSLVFHHDIGGNARMINSQTTTEFLVCQFGVVPEWKVILSNCPKRVLVWDDIQVRPERYHSLPARAKCLGLWAVRSDYWSFLSVSLNPLPPPPPPFLLLNRGKPIRQSRFHDV